jgi:hypothetical protein
VSRTPPRASARVRKEPAAVPVRNSDDGTMTPPLPASRIASSIRPAPAAPVSSARIDSAEGQNAKKRKADSQSVRAYAPQYEEMDMDLDDIGVIEAPASKRPKTVDLTQQTPATQAPTQPSTKPPQPRPAQSSSLREPPRAPSPRPAPMPSAQPSSSSKGSSRPVGSAHVAPRAVPSAQPSRPKPSPAVPVSTVDTSAPERIPPPPTRKPLPQGPSASAKVAPSKTPATPAAAPKKASTNILGSIIASMGNPPS